MRTSRTAIERAIGILLLGLLFAAPAYGQSSAMNRVIQVVRESAAANGFEVLDSGSAFTHWESALEFEVTAFRANTQYSAVALVDNCAADKCEVSLLTQDMNTGQTVDKVLPTRYEGSVGIANHIFEQSRDGNGRILLYVNTTRSYYTHTLLLARSQ